MALAIKLDLSQSEKRINPLLRAPTHPVSSAGRIKSRHCFNFLPSQSKKDMLGFSDKAPWRPSGFLYRLKPDGDIYYFFIYLLFFWVQTLNRGLAAVAHHASAWVPGALWGSTSVHTQPILPPGLCNIVLLVGGDTGF